MCLLTKLELQLAGCKDRQQLRQRQSVLQLDQGHCQVDGGRYVNFASNDYLGLSQHIALKKAAVQAVEQYGVGSGSSAQVTGFHPEHEALQQEFAEWLGVDAVLLYSSGYMANIGALTALLSRGEVVVHDRDNHASLLDGSLQAQARIRRFAHHDMQALAGLLNQLKVNWVVSEALFSMDGSLTAIAELIETLKFYQANLLLDETHSLGILGAFGRGVLADNVGKVPENYVLTAGLGKAFGVMGGIAAGSKILIDYLTQFSRSAIYTTAQPPAIAAAARASLSLIRSEVGEALREQLYENITLFCHCCQTLGVNYQGGTTAIQVVLLKTEGCALRWQSQLKKLGFWVAVMRPPTVAQGTSRLRITLTAMHDKADIQNLVNALAWLQESNDR